MKTFSSTKVANLRRISRNQRLKITVWVAVGVIIVLLVLPRLFSFTASLVLMPVVAAEDWLRESDAQIAVYLRDRNLLSDRINELERQLAEAEITESTLSNLAVENEKFRALLGSSTTSERIGAGVIGRPTEMPYDVFIIDKGRSDGVIKNSPVYLGRDQVIGMVAEVFENSAVVGLVTTPGLESTVYIYGPNIYTTAEGLGGGLLRVNVPQGIDLAEGNLVIIPSFASGVYGSVTLVESVPSEPEQYGYVTIDTPLASVRFVSVGRDELNPISFEQAKVVIDTVRTELTTVPVPEAVLVDVLSTSSPTSSQDEL